MTIRLFNAVVIGLLVFTGCSKDKDSDGNNNNETTKQAYVADLSGSYSSEGNYAHAIRIQKDGKILVLGYKWFIRLEKDGVTVDKTFNPISEIAASDINLNFELQDDGKIIVFGHFVLSNGRRAIVRLNADGSIDNSFNIPKINFDYFNGNYSGPGVDAIKILDNGKMILAGDLDYETSSAGIYGKDIVRLNADQSIDNSFSSPISADNFFGIRHMLLLKSGGFLLSGYGAVRLKDGLNYAVVKINADGVPDKSYFFDSGGVLNVRSFNSEAMSELADGKVLISWTDAYAVFGHTVRLNSNGSVDAGFNQFDTRGMVRALLVLPDKSIFVGNDPDVATPESLFYLSADGKEDTTFHPGLSSESSVFFLASIDENTILVGGYLAVNDKTYALMRFKKNK